MKQKESNHLYLFTKEVYRTSSTTLGQACHDQLCYGNGEGPDY